MDVIEAILTRRSIRKYKPDAIPDEHIDLLLEVAQRAPNASNKEDWLFVVVKDAAVRQRIQQTTEARLAEVAAWPEVADWAAQVRGLAHGSSFIPTAPLLMVFFARPYRSLVDEAFEAHGVPLEEFYRRRAAVSVQSVSAAIENVCLAAHALGYGACWIGPGAASFETKRLLGMEDPWDLVAYLPIGIPDEAPPLRPRQPRSQVVRFI